MATTTWPVQTNASSKAAVQNAANTFVPIIWADEVLAQREKMLYAAKFFKRFNHKGKKGDTIRIPFITRTTPNDKTATNPVTIQTQAEGKIDVAIDKHKEISRLFEDFLMLQSDYNLRSEYTREDAYAIAQQIDSDIFALFDAGLPAAYKVIGSDGVTQYAANNHADITDIGLRRVIQTLEDNDVDTSECALFIPPSQKNALLGIDKFTLYQNIGRTSEIQKGDFGEIYGVKVKVTTNMPTKDNGRIAVLAHKDAVCSVIQQDVRTQVQYKLEYLANLVVLDCVYGVKALRVGENDTSTSNNRLSHAVAIYVP